MSIVAPRFREPVWLRGQVAARWRPGGGQVAAVHEAHAHRSNHSSVARIASKVAARMKTSALRLSLRRLGGTFGGRIGWLGALGVAIAFGAAASSGEDMSGEAVRVLCWIAAGPTALAASRAPALRDRADGIEFLVATRGVDAASFRRIRVAAATLSCCFRVLLPTLLVAATTVAVTMSGAVVARSLGAVVGGALAGALIGWVAALCGEAGGERGRSLFVAVILLPWMLGGLWSVPGLSLVGAVDAGLSILTKVAVSWP